MNLFAPLPPDTRRLLDDIHALIDATFPLPGRFRSSLPADVAELSRLLTSGRGERGLSYMGRPQFLSAYLRFFLPWNLYRLCRLLPGLDINLAAQDRITDLGCGPLTLAAALWISRPELRLLPLEFQCIDRSGPALDAGKKFFSALAGENCPWKIHTIKGELGAITLKPAALVCAVNVFNEMHGDISRWNTGSLKHNATKAAAVLTGHTVRAGQASILLVEPGFPRCGEFISLLRTGLLERGHEPLAPCPHDKRCPFPGGKSTGGKNRWCHFSWETGDAPSALHRLSRAAGIPKERAVLSFLYTRERTEHTVLPPGLRVISDAFPLPGNRFGRYCCSDKGLVLLAGEKNSIVHSVCGSLIQADYRFDGTDPKSNALLALKT